MTVRFNKNDNNCCKVNSKDTVILYSVLVANDIYLCNRLATVVEIVLCCCRHFYRSEDYDLLQVSAEVKELFEYVKKYVIHFHDNNQRSF